MEYKRCSSCIPGVLIRYYQPGQLSPVHVVQAMIIMVGALLIMVGRSRRLLLLIFIGNFLYPVTWVLYAVSALIGLGAALIWTGQGNYLTINSDEQTQSRNTGIFWALFQCSMLLGNLFVFLELQGVSKIDETTRQLVYGVLTGVCLIGIVLLVFLRGGRPGEVPEKTESEHSKDDCEIPEGIPEPALPAKKETLGQSIVKSFKLLKTPPMMLLSLTFFYTGLELSFYSGVYSAAIGQTLNIATDAKKYVGLSGMIIGAGEIIGGLLFTILGSKTNRLGRDMIVLLGFVVQIIAFYLCFLNLPPLSPIHDTPQPAFINSRYFFFPLFFIHD
ncbi:MFSD11 [Cordylochernes scorpioides]|uniref:UNC93-like protein MFSD11 n=1 Tax=Cordylochernes scorpioides TaxID=51811 RepID=A0ABY6KQV5_9ARAC|nr:MFSD11 [Cordylochernes scorpioides]